MKSFVFEVKEWLRALKYTKKKSKFYQKPVEQTFKHIYESNYWANPESVSGNGSDLSQTKTLLREFKVLGNELEITSILDIPCGDFNWMRNFEFENINYIGADIVDDLIKNNKEKYGKRFEFKVLNLIENELPKVDLIFTRDCFVHLSESDIFKSIQNIKKSGSKYLLTTTFPTCKQNRDIVTGDWRRINLETRPYNFPKPLKVINENCTEFNGDYKDKSMALWKISDL